MRTILTTLLVCAGLPCAAYGQAVGVQPPALPIKCAGGSCTISNTLPNLVGTTTFYADLYSGADASVKINACIQQAILSSGILRSVTVTTGTDTSLPNSGSWITSGGGGTGATGTFTASGGNLATVTITTGGAGYASNPTLVPNSGSIGTSAISFAGDGGTCDARKLGGTQSQAMSQTIALGSVGQSANAVGVTLLLPNTGLWTWGLTGGTACGLYQYGGTSLIGTAVGGGSNRMYLDAAGGANMDSLYCTEASPSGGGAYIRAEGFYVRNSGGGAFANGLAHFRKLWDESHFQWISVNNPTGDGMVIEQACCGDTFDNFYVYGSGATTNNASGYPLKILGGTIGDAAIKISNSTFNGPGKGKYNIYIAPTGGATVRSLTFDNVYLEKYSTDDASTALVYNGANSNGVHFTGGYAWPGTQCNSACTQVIFENHSDDGFQVDNFGIYYTDTAAINDVANGISIPGPSGLYDWFAHYSATITHNGSYANGPIPQIVYVNDQTAQTANLAGTYTVPSTDAGAYRATCYVVLTRAATSSSTLPNCYINYTDEDTSHGNSYWFTGNGYTGNSVGGSNLNQASANGAIFNAAASSTIQIGTTNYASSGATAMQYAVHVQLELLRRH